MFSRSQIWMDCVVLSVFAILAAAGRNSNADGPTPPADNWMAELVAAEVEGDTALRAKVLESVVEQQPDLSIAHWQLGQIEVDGEWQSVEAVQQAAVVDPRQSKYAALRASIGGSPQAQLTLARWCRKNGLADEARAHWLNVLAVEPNHDEALRALRLEWLDGKLLSKDQITAAKAEARQRDKSFKQWTSQIQVWYREMDGDLAERTRILSTVSAIRDPSALAAIESFALTQPVNDDLAIIRHRQISHAFLDALNATSTYASMQSLNRLTILSPHQAIRKAAVQRLKARSFHDYVPILLDWLSLPVKSRFAVTTGIDGGVHYEHLFYRSGPFADWSVKTLHNFEQRDGNGHIYVVRRSPTEAYGDILHGRNLIARDLGPVGTTDQEVDDQVFDLAIAARARAQSVAAQRESAVALYNQQTYENNSRVVPVLTQTTGQEFGLNVQDWWNWWQDYSEYDNSGATPVYEYRWTDYSYCVHRPPQYSSGSCFVKGTLVWTKTGHRPIESLCEGDLVLSKCVDTGELAYKPVVGTTIRPPCTILRLTLGNEMIATTLGHQFWVSGEGWRMAKQLSPDLIIHGLNEPVRLSETSAAQEKAEAYNLIVADFNSYFVGEGGLLVHDNTPVRPTASVVPGIAMSEK